MINLNSSNSSFKTSSFKNTVAIKASAFGRIAFCLGFFTLFYGWAGAVLLSAFMNGVQAQDTAVRLVLLWLSFAAVTTMMCMPTQSEINTRAEAADSDDDESHVVRR